MGPGCLVRPAGPGCLVRPAGPGCLVRPWAAARPRDVRAASHPCCVLLLGAPLVFRAPEGPAAREIATREPKGSEWSISKPARALRSLRRPPRRWRLCCWCVAWCVVSKPGQAPPPPINFARNSPAACSNIEFASLELQRFWGVSKNDHDKLRAKFGRRWCRCCLWAPQPGPPVPPAPPRQWRLCCWCVAWRVVSKPGQAPPPPINFARNSPAACSNIEFASLELQRFWGVSKNDHDKLRAKFGRRWCRCCLWAPRPGPPVPPAPPHQWCLAAVVPPVGIAGASSAAISGRSLACCYKRRQSEVFFEWISDSLLQMSSIRRLFR